MTANTAGYVSVFDGGAPRFIGGKARTDISGGEFVYASGASNSVSSGANSFATTDLLFTNDASGALVNGVAVYNVDSGGEVLVATKGAVIAKVNGTGTAGYSCEVDGSNAVAVTGSVTLATGFQGRSVGKLLTEAASGGHAIVHLNL